MSEALSLARAVRAMTSPSTTMDPYERLSAIDDMCADYLLKRAGENSPSSVISPLASKNALSSGPPPTYDHMNAHLHGDGSIGYEYPCHSPTPTPTEKPCEPCGGSGVDEDEARRYRSPLHNCRWPCSACKGSGVTPTEKAGERP